MVKSSRKKFPGQDNMREFHRRTDWAELWEEFFLEVDPSGLPKYKRISEFARAHAKSAEQMRFMIYYLGAPTDDEEERKRYPFCTPQNWKKKRETGGWYSDDNIKQLARCITSKINGLEALRSAGEEVTLPAMLRIGQLFQRLDEAFGGRFFVGNLDFKDNIARAEAYIRLYSRLMGIMGQAQDLYAKSHGINFDNMEGLVHILQATASMAKQVGASESRADKAMKALLSMTMEKYAEFDLPLPDEAKRKIIDATSLEEDDQPVPKKKLH